MLQFTEKKNTMQMRRLHPPTIAAGAGEATRHEGAGGKGRHHLLLLLLLVGFVALTSGASSNVAERPHIIFILADDLVSGPNKPLDFHSLFFFFRALMISDFAAPLRFPRPISMLWPIRVSYSIVTMSIRFVHPRDLP